MGGLSFHFLKACITPQSPKIKLLTAEGKCSNYVAPITVKEVLMDHPLHAIFDSEKVRKESTSRARPLQGTFLLQPGHLYFLLRLRPSRQNSMMSSATSTAPSSSHEAAQKCGTCTRRVSFAEVPVEHLAFTKSLDSYVGSSESHSPLRESSVQILPSPCDGVVRLKMVVSKRELARVLKDGDCVSMVEGFLSPLLQVCRIDAQSAASASASASDDLLSSRSWRPSLESIPESTGCPFVKAFSNAHQ